MSGPAREAKKTDRLAGDRRRQVMTACAPCRISHRCCDEPRPCKRCTRLQLNCLPGDTPLTAELIAEDKRMRMNGRKKKRPSELQVPNIESQPVIETGVPAAYMPAAALQDILSAEDPHFLSLLESVPRNLAPQSEVQPITPPGSEPHVTSLISSTGLSMLSSLPYDLVPQPLVAQPVLPQTQLQHTQLHQQQPLPAHSVLPLLPSYQPTPSSTARESVDILLNLSSSLPYGTLDLTSSTPKRRDE